MQDARTGVFQSRHDFNESLTARKYFWAVAKVYLDVLETPPLVSVSCTDIPNRKLNAQMIEFKVDCDNAVKAGLDNNASLIEDFHSLIRGESVQNENDIIKRVAKKFRRFKLIPHEYFITIKRGRKRHQAGAA